MDYVKILPRILLGTLLLSMPALATGPRITHSLLSPESRQVYATEIPPFISSDVANQGMVAELAETALTAAGIDAVVEILPLQKMVRYYLLQEQALAGLGVNLDFSPEEKKDLIVIPVLVAEQRYYVYKSGSQAATKWTGDLNSLKGLRYGALEGGRASTYKNAGIQVEEGRALSLLKEVKENRLDFIGLPTLSAAWLTNRHFANEQSSFVSLQPAAGWTTVAIVFNKKHPKGEDAARKFSSAFSAMLKDGRYSQILEKHLGKSDDIKLYVKRLEQAGGR